MLMLTTPLPGNLKLIKSFSLIWSVSQVEISNKGLLKKVLQGAGNEYQEAFDSLNSQVPSEANAVVGIQVSTATHEFTNGTFLYVTLIGTPVLYEESERDLS